MELCGAGGVVYVRRLAAPHAMSISHSLCGSLTSRNFLSSKGVTMKIRLVFTARVAYLACCLICLSAMMCRAQGGTLGSASAAEGGNPRMSAQEAAGLVGRIKTVESPAFRAYLYSRVVTQLKSSAEGMVLCGR